MPVSPSPYYSYIGIAVERHLNCNITLHDCNLLRVNNPGSYAIKWGNSKHDCQFYIFIIAIKEDILYLEKGFFNIICFYMYRKIGSNGRWGNISLLQQPAVTNKMLITIKIIKYDLLNSLIYQSCT